jgi:hypothetical protein
MAEKLTNDELLKMSDPNIPANVKDYICKQKMAPEEIDICRRTGTALYDYMIEKTIEQ